MENKLVYTKNSPGASLYACIGTDSDFEVVG